MRPVKEITMPRILQLNKKKPDGKIVQHGKLEIKNETSESADLYIYGYISSFKWDDEDVVPADVKTFLDSVKDVKKLNIYINSGGGSVFAGMAIHNMIKRMPANKTVYVDGLAASIASVIAFAGDKIVIPSNSYLMIHKPLIMAYGNAVELRDLASVLDKIEDGILNVYMEKAKDGVDREMISDLVNDETWFTGEDAADYFDIELSSSVQAVAYCMTERCKHIPDDVKANSSNPADIISCDDEKIKMLKAKMQLACEI